ncbi:RES family NAD+ phosphorylase [Parapedobacter sp.]
MTVYRLAYHGYVEDLSGIGARLYGGRWNPKGMACLYTSVHISLALLEKFVHARGREDMAGLMLLSVELPDHDDLVYHVDESRMVDGWMNDIDYSQWLGEQLLVDEAFVAFSVPSAIMPLERNVIINPQARHFDAVKFHKPTPFDIDGRLMDRLV